MNMRSVGISILPALLAVVAMGGCAGTSPAPTATPGVDLPTSITVSLGIYSGRVDPSWDLTEAEIAQVATAIAALPLASARPPEGGLGYRGFSLLMRWPGRADETLIAYRGAVAAPGVGARSVFVDEGRTIERLLLDTGRPVLDANEVAAVDADLAVAP
ncbi:MAG: hypothetical protein QFC55_03640 [Chloroflexota bacterium]|nr:hypothetical protein [Chloroflexota bacterium]